MLFIKTRANELAALGKPMDVEDLTEKILDGLDDYYKPIINIINGRDTPISFDELHEKLINKELSLYLHLSNSSPLPASTNQVDPRSNLGNFGNLPQCSSWASSYQNIGKSGLRRLKRHNPGWSPQSDPT